MENQEKKAIPNSDCGPILPARGHVTNASLAIAGCRGCGNIWGPIVGPGRLQGPPTLGRPIEQIFTNILQKNKPKLYKIYTEGCLPVCNGPQDVLYHFVTNLYYFLYYFVKLLKFEFLDVCMTNSRNS